jgi:hypothetical protein
VVQYVAKLPNCLAFCLPAVARHEILDDQQNFSIERSMTVAPIRVFDQWLMGETPRPPSTAQRECRGDE